MIHEKLVHNIPSLHLCRVLVHSFIFSTTHACLDSSPLQKCWIDLLYALASKPEAVIHVVTFRAGLSHVPLEVTDFIQIFTGAKLNRGWFGRLSYMCSYSISFLLIHTEICAAYERL